VARYIVLVSSIIGSVWKFAKGVIADIPREALLALSVAGVIGLAKLAWNRWRRRGFKKVFGARASEYKLAFGSMVVRPDLLILAAPSYRRLAQFPLAKIARPDMAFSAQSVASGCEIRAVAYVGSALNKEGRISSRVVTDDSIRQELDLDFVAFGAMSNLKTLDMFGNPANDLADYDPTMECFVSKTDRSPLYARRSGFDYGIILKVHPTQFPRRSWISCAGVGEWGTSGSAWFLANRWREISRQIRGDEKFLCVLEVTPGQDESSRSLGIRTMATQKLTTD